MDFVAEVADPRTLATDRRLLDGDLAFHVCQGTMLSAAAGDAWYSPNPTTSSDNPNFPPSQLQWAARSAAYASVRPPVRNEVELPQPGANLVPTHENLAHHKSVRNLRDSRASGETLPLGCKSGARRARRR